MRTRITFEIYDGFDKDLSEIGITHIGCAFPARIIKEFTHVEITKNGWFYLTPGYDLGTTLTIDDLRLRRQSRK